uniref:Uncharacterized protein n=1 Tax=Peronospora matthiolae TaxID=2874970 RepID=A0AAV1VLP8_9STRA
MAERAACTYYLNMNKSRVRKLPAGAPATVATTARFAVPVAAVNAAAKPTGNVTAKSSGNAAAQPAGNSSAKALRSGPRVEKSAAILRWLTTRKRRVKVPAALPTAKKGLDEWIMGYTTELTKPITAVPHPINFLQQMTMDLLLSFVHAINSEVQFAVILKFTAYRNLLAKIRGLCTGRADVAGVQEEKTMWITTNSIRKWALLEQHDKKLVCAKSFSQCKSTSEEHSTPSACSFPNSRLPTQKLPW